LIGGRKLKRLIYLAVLCVVPLTLWAAAPVNNSATELTASTVVDSQYAADAWTSIGSQMVVSKTDTCDTYYHFSGYITLQPDQRFYVKFLDGAATESTARVYQLPEGSDAAMTIYIGAVYVDSLRSQTDASDSITVKCAVGGDTHWEEVTLVGARLTGTVIDFDAA
jgi:hypothetical protein